MSVGKLSARSLAMSGLIAALYAALSLVSTAVGLGFDAVQLRLSEALCLLPRSEEHTSELQFTRCRPPRMPSSA